MATAEQIPGSHVKLFATPTSGLPAEHSPYFRKLISAGYKGYIQGNVAGASLYGVLGAVVGAVTGLALLPFVGPAGFAAVPALFGLGIMKGADTFGKIGSNAAQLAEFAEMNEHRRALLDRLDETPSENEAQEIRKILHEDLIDKKPKDFIHWRTAIVGALVGAAAFVSLAYLGVHTEVGHGLVELVKGFIGADAVAVMTAGSTGLSATFLSAAGALGAAVGSMIGIDRGWIRRWFDFSEDIVHDRQHYEEISHQRAIEVSRLHDISQEDTPETPHHPSNTRIIYNERPENNTGRDAIEMQTKQALSVDEQAQHEHGNKASAPSTRIASSQEQGRLADQTQIEYGPSV
jgi:hypothetical protein